MSNCFVLEAWLTELGSSVVHLHIHCTSVCPKQPILIISFTLCCVIILFSCLTAQIYLTSFFSLKGSETKRKRRKPNVI